MFLFCMLFATFLISLLPYFLVEIVRIIPGGKEVQSCEEDRGHLGPGMKNDGDRKKEERENVLLVLTVWSML